MFEGLLKITTEYREVLNRIATFPQEDQAFFKKLAQEEIRAKWKKSITPVTAENTSDDEDDFDIEAYRMSDSDLVKLANSLFFGDDDE